MDSSSDQLPQPRVSRSKAHRKASISFEELTAIHEESHRVSPHVVVKPEQSPKYMEHSEIFEELCDKVENEDDMVMKAPVVRRRSSLSGGQQSSTYTNVGSSMIGGLMMKEQQQPQDDPTLTTTASSVDPCFAYESAPQPRRHSSYEPRLRSEHRQHHDAVKEYNVSRQHSQGKHRAEFVRSLLDFNLSVDTFGNSLSELNGADPATTNLQMHVSCPVLSYMNDDEEDSVDLAQWKRPSMVYREDAEAQNWESLKSEYDEEEDIQEESREYVIELPDMSSSDEEETRPQPPRAGVKRSRRHSYQVLEQRLQEESPLQVLKSLNMSVNNSSFACSLSNLNEEEEGEQKQDHLIYYPVKQLSLGGQQQQKSEDDYPKPVTAVGPQREPVRAAIARGA